MESTTNEIKNEIKNDMEDSLIVREIERKQAKQSTILFLVCLLLFVIGVVGTVLMRIKMDNQDLQGIEKVQVRVVDVVEKNVRVNGSTNISYKVTVEYEGKEYKLEDGGTSPWTVKGYTGTAYMYKNRIYANENGPSTRTGVGTLYFVFLLSTFALLFITPSVGAKARQQRKRLL